MRRYAVVLTIAGACAIALACASSGAGGRRVEITQRDDGCTPTSISAAPGEKLNLVVTNESSHDPFELEGIDGTAFEEMGVPEGKTRSAGFTLPGGGGGPYRLKCYVPGGVATIIEVSAGEGGAAVRPSAAVTVSTAGETPAATIAVTLADYTVTAERTTSGAGTIAFSARNASSDHVHELAVLREAEDGALENEGEVEDIAPGETKVLTVDLTPGKYQLACLIAKGQAGSDVDHYQRGMHTEFVVSG